MTGFSYAELSSIFPKSAAEYVYAKNVFGNDFAASIIGCLTYSERETISPVLSECIGFSKPSGIGRSGTTNNIMSCDFDILIIIIIRDRFYKIDGII